VDPHARPFGSWVQDEICAPLKIDRLFLGVPEALLPNVAHLTAHGDPSTWQQRPAAGNEPSLGEIAMPPRVGLIPEVYNRADVLKSCIPGTGGVMNARSAARFFAFIANGGELDGVRLLSQERVAWLAEPRPGSSGIDPVLGRVIPLG